MGDSRGEIIIINLCNVQERDSNMSVGLRLWREACDVVSV